MAGVLEKKEVKRYIDDTTPLKCTIVGTKPFQSYVEYIIKVQRGYVPEDTWETSHRYSEFADLHKHLSSTSGVDLPIPPKKLFGSSDKSTVAARQQGLQDFLDAVAAHPLLRYDLEYLQFINPREFSEDFAKKAMRNVSLFFRSQPDQVMDQQLIGFGWRVKKHFFLMSAKGKSKAKKVLSWMEPGPDMCLSEKEVEASIRVLSSLQHPNIVTAESVWYSSNGLLVIRPFEARGSLRDLIYECDPTSNVLKKYGSPARRPPPPRDIARYGRQILEALKFLNEKGFVLGHVHPGNVLVDGNGNCQLTELENSILGQPSIYRPYMVKTKKVRSTELQVVYSFGHLLYELCSGRPLGDAFMERTPPSSGALEEILCRLLTQEKIKEGLPSISQLIEMEFFKIAWYSPGTDKPVLKVGSKLREVLRNAKEVNEQRLYQDQKKMAQGKRLEKTATAAKSSDSMLMTEEERKKKYKQKKKNASAPVEDEDESYPTTLLQQPQSKPSTASSSTTSASSKSSSSTSTHKTSSSSSKSSSSKKSSSKSSSSSGSRPPPAPAAPPPPGPPPPPPPSSSGSSERGALLSSIHTFSKKGLKKAVTNDRSAPKV